MISRLAVAVVVGLLRGVACGYLALAILSVQKAEENLLLLRDQLTTELDQERAESARLLRQREQMADEVRAFLSDWAKRRDKGEWFSSPVEFYNWTTERVFALRDRIDALASGKEPT